MSKSVFITGATGYIGGQALYELLNNKEGTEYVVTALVRSEAKGENLKKAANKSSNTNNSRVETVVGSLDDLDLIKEEVGKNDIIINTANVDHVPSAEVLSEALVASKEEKILIHTSGTSILGDGVSDNKGPTTKVYSDIKDIDEINSLEDKQPHRPVDVIILDINRQNPKITTAVICPSHIVGISDGYDNRLSIQTPSLIRTSKKHGQAFSVYSGQYIWSQVHIKDLGNLYHLILTKIIAKESIPLNREGYYFGSYWIDNEPEVTTKPTDIEHTWRSLSEAVGKGLHARKLIDSPEVVELDSETIEKLTGDPFGPYYWGTNSRSRGDNGKKIGWKPKYTSLDDYWKTVEEDIDYLVQKGELN